MKTSRVFFTSDNNEDNDPNTVVYSFKPSFRYAPMTQVMAYYIKENGDFVTGQAYIQLDKDLPNYVSYSINFVGRKNLGPHLIIFSAHNITCNSGS